MSDVVMTWQEWWVVERLRVETAEDLARVDGMIADGRAWVHGGAVEPVEVFSVGNEADARKRAAQLQAKYAPRVFYALLVVAVREPL